MFIFRDNIFQEFFFKICLPLNQTSTNPTVEYQKNNNSELNPSFPSKLNLSR